MLKNIMWSMSESHKLLLLTFTTLMVVVPSSISQSQERPHNVPEIWGTTDIKIYKLKYAWTIKNLQFCCQNVGEIIKSPTFSSNGCKWYMDIRPKGEDEKVKDYVSLYLFSVNCNTTAVVNFSILNSKREQTSMKTFSYKFIPPNAGRGYADFILQTSLLNPENNYMADNKLTIICEITATLDKENSLGKFVQPKRRLGEHLGLLFENEIFSDVTLIAGGKEFKVHKAVLAARSPVFKATFEKDIKTGKNSIVELTDVDPKTLSEMLRYIYTEETPNLEKLAAKLLAAAENYELVELKTMCEEVLRANLSNENAIEFFILGDKYRAANLKMEAKNFIAAHASDITNTTAFKSLILTQPRLAVETFKLIG